MTAIRKMHVSGLALGLLLGAGPGVLAQKRLPIGGSTVPPMSGQSPMPPSASDSGRSTSPLGTMIPDESDSSVRRNLDALRVNMANTERQKMMSRDAALLLRMAAELQMKIAKNETGLSQEEMLREVDAIEKLARNVKDRMKGVR